LDFLSSSWALTCGWFCQLIINGLLTLGKFFASANAKQFIMGSKIYGGEGIELRLNSFFNGQGF
jgi:hypothetical protein